MDDLTDEEKEIIDRMARMELAGDLPPGGAARAAEAYINALRNLKAKRQTLLDCLMKRGK